MDDEAHQGWVQLPTLPALVGLLALVGPLVGLQVRRLVEPSLTLRAVEHLSACVCGAAVHGPVGPDVRVILCRREFRHEAQPSAVTIRQRAEHGRSSQDRWSHQTELMGHLAGLLFQQQVWRLGSPTKRVPAGGDGCRVGSELSPRDKKSRPSSHSLQSVSLMDTFLRTG